jgi:hypothetical protein
MAQPWMFMMMMMMMMMIIFFEVTTRVASLHDAAYISAGRLKLKHVYTTEHVALSMHNSQISPTAHRSYASFCIPYANKSDR